MEGRAGWRREGSYEQGDKLESVHPALDEIFHGFLPGCFVRFILVLLGH